MRKTFNLTLSLDHQNGADLFKSAEGQTAVLKMMALQSAQSQEAEITSQGINAEKETQLTITNSRQTFVWKGYGLKLNIPPHALPDNTQSCTITIKASLSGQYQLPRNTELVSPVFWLKCYPMCKFRTPLTLEIQHCAPLTNTSHLFIARALCTQPNLPYEFKLLRGGIFSTYSSYGVIDLNHFSGVCAVQEGSGGRRYWSSVFYMGPHKNQKIHFAVTWHSDAHITVSVKDPNV